MFSPWSPPLVRFTSCVLCDWLGFDAQIIQVGHKLVYNEAVLVLVKINILLLCERVTGCCNTISICKEGAPSKGRSTEQAAQFVLLHYVKDTKKLKAGKGLSNLVM